MINGVVAFDSICPTFDIDKPPSFDEDHYFDFGAIGDENRKSTSKSNKKHMNGIDMIIRPSCRQQQT
jgi:hypothetical protein